MGVQKIRKEKRVEGKDKEWKKERCKEGSGEKGDKIRVSESKVVRKENDKQK